MDLQLKKKAVVLSINRISIYIWMFKLLFSIALALT